MKRKYREYTYEEYMKAMELIEKGYGLTETCRILGWPEKKKSTLYFWKHGRVPPLARWRAEPSKELAYALGTIHGDGTVSKNEANYEYLIKLATIDKEFVEVFSRAMARTLNRKYTEPYWSEKDKAWVIEYYSRAFVKWYKKTEKHGLEGFKPFIEYSKETIKYYLKGMYDSEGNNYRNRQIQLCNINIELLEYVQYLLEKYFDVKATGPYLQRKAGTKTIVNGMERRYNQDFCVIAISKKLHVQKYLEEIGFTIVRKQLGLKKHEKVFVEGIGYVEPYKLVKLGLFRLPFSDNQ